MTKQHLIKYLSIAFFIALFFILMNAFSDSGVNYSFMQYIGLLIAMTIVPGAGMFIGNILRLKLMPDMIFTRNGMTGLAKAKIFWAIGPQTIGWFLGIITIGSMINEM